MYTVEHGRAASVGLPEEYGRDSGGELVNLNIRRAWQATDESPTEGHTKCKIGFYMHDGQHAHGCVALQDFQAPCLGLTRQNELIALRGGSNTHVHKSRCTHDNWRTEAVIGRDLATELLIYAWSTRRGVTKRLTIRFWSPMRSPSTPRRCVGCV